jgi:hypothetical protein
MDRTTPPGIEGQAARCCPAHVDAVGIVVGEMQHDRNSQPDIRSMVYPARVRAKAKNVGQDVI